MSIGFLIIILSNSMANPYIFIVVGVFIVIVSAILLVKNKKE